MSSSIAFIGAGRLATTLAIALSRAGAHVAAVASRDPAHASTLARRIEGCSAASFDQAARADLVFITVSDDAIGPVAASLAWRAGQRVVHCSGATEVSVLAPASNAGAMIGGFHPLQTFADPERALTLLAETTAAIEGPPALEAELHDLATRLGMRTITLPPGMRARYHGGASFAASFLLSMLDEAAAVWKSFGIDEADAMRALLPLARGNLDAAMNKGIAGSLAGPISRGDTGVIERHLQALDALGAPHGNLYREMSLRQLELARRTGRLDASQIDRITALLQRGALR